MATITYWSDGYYCKFFTSVWISSQSKSDNTTTVGYEVWCYNQFWDPSYGHARRPKIKLSVGGGLKADRTVTLTAGAGSTHKQKIVERGYAKFKHASNGKHDSIKIYLSVYANGDLPGAWNATRSDTSYLKLPDIPRKSGYKSISGSTVPGRLRVDISPSCSEARHYIQARFPERNGMRYYPPGLEKSTDGYFYFRGNNHKPNSKSDPVSTWDSIDLDYSAFKNYPDWNSVNVDISLQTFIGGKNLGWNNYGTRTLTLASNYHGFFKEGPGITHKSSDIQKKFGKLVEGKSQVQIWAKAEPSVAGGWINKVVGRHANVDRPMTKSSDGYYYSSVFTVGKGEASSINNGRSFWSQITDSRNRTQSSYIKGDCYSYSKPVIYGKTSAVRCDKHGNTDVCGDRIRVDTSFWVQSMDSKNDHRLSFWIKNTNGGSYGEAYRVDAPKSNGDFSVTLPFHADPLETITVGIQLDDYFEHAWAERVVPPEFVYMGLNRTKRGIAFGKPCEKDELEVGIATEFYEDVKFKAKDGSVHTLSEVWEKIK